jgi:hypothetical protein
LLNPVVEAVMNRFAWAVLGICCAAPLGAQEVKVFTPSGSGDAPIYANGQIVRIDAAAGTVTLRTDSGQRVMNVDRQALASLRGLRAGDSVIIGSRVTGGTGRAFITDIRPTTTSRSLSVPTRGRVSVNASALSTGARSMGTARVVSVDANGRRMTVVDSSGTTRVLDVRGNAVTSLGSLRAGQDVSLGIGAPLVNSTPAGTVTSIGAAGQVTADRAGQNTANRAGQITANSMTGTSTGSAGQATTNTGRGTSTGTVSQPTANTTRGTTGRSTGTASSSDFTPGAPALPAGPPSGISTNPGVSGVQPVPQAQPLPGVQGPTGVQPVPNAQPLPGRGATGRDAANPNLAVQPVPGTGGQTSNNAGATGGTAPAGAQGTATRGGTTNSGTTNNGSTTVGGGSPFISTGAVPQLGNNVPVTGINSQIPNIGPTFDGSGGVVLPAPSVMPETNPPTTPAEVATVRELGSRDFDMAIAVLATRAAEVDRAWAVYRSSCESAGVPLNGRQREWFGILDGSLTAPTEDTCEQAFNEVARMAMSLKSQLDTARDSARRADVLPGHMREILQRYNLDS